MIKSIKVNNKESELIAKLNENKDKAKKEYIAPVAKIISDSFKPAHDKKGDTQTRTPLEEKIKQDIDRLSSVINAIKGDANCQEMNFPSIRPYNPSQETAYESVNHPKHYNNYDMEVIDMMVSVFGLQKTIDFCKLNAFKYRMRMGSKPTSPLQEDYDKEQWYLNKARELEGRL